MLVPWFTGCFHAGLMNGMHNACFNSFELFGYREEQGKDRNSSLCHFFSRAMRGVCQYRLLCGRQSKGARPDAHRFVSLVHLGDLPRRGCRSPNQWTCRSVRLCSSAFPPLSQSFEAKIWANPSQAYSLSSLIFCQRYHWMCWTETCFA